MRKYLTGGILAGLVMALTHAQFTWLGPFALAPLLWVLRTAGLREALWAGLLAGLGEASVLAGVLHSSGKLATAVCLFIGCTRALFAMSVVGLRAQYGVFGPPVAAAAWIFWEVIEAQVPYTLPALFGDTQHQGMWLPIARVGGTYLVSGMLVWAAALCANAWEAAREAFPMSLISPAWRLWGAQATAFAVLVGGLHLAAHTAAPTRVGAMKMALVQGGLPTWVYTRALVDKASEQPESIYTQLTRRAPKASLTVWPETSVWRSWGADPDWMQRLDDLAHARGGLLVGTPRRDRGQGMYNSAVLLGDGAPRVVDKQRLALNAEAGFIPGLPHGTTSFHDVPLGILFCLETVVPDYSVQQVRDGARVLVALVEGSRFGTTPVGRMHAQRSRVRAMETGRAVVHAGQHGYSMVAWPDGTASATLLPFTANVLVEDVPVYTGITPFVSLGLWSLSPLWVVLAMAVARRIYMQIWSHTYMT